MPSLCCACTVLLKGQLLQARAPYRASYSHSSERLQQIQAENARTVTHLIAISRRKVQWIDKLAAKVGHLLQSSLLQQCPNLQPLKVGEVHIPYCYHWRALSLITPSGVCRESASTIPRELIKRSRLRLELHGKTTDCKGGCKQSRHPLKSAEACRRRGISKLPGTAKACRQKHKTPQRNNCLKLRVKQP